MGLGVGGCGVGTCLCPAFEVGVGEHDRVRGEGEAPPPFVSGWLPTCLAHVADGWWGHGGEEYVYPALDVYGDPPMVVRKCTPYRLGLRNI